MKKLILGLVAVLFLSCGEKKDENQINLGDYNHEIDSTTTVTPPGSFSSDTTAVDSLSKDSLSRDSTQNQSTKGAFSGNELPI